MLSAMVNAAFWLGIKPFEGRRLRPVFRWASPDLPGQPGTCKLSSPVPLSDLESVRRIAAAWGAPKKLLVESSPAPVISGLAMEAGLWSAPHPSLVVESSLEGSVLLSSFGNPLAELSDGRITRLSGAQSFADLISEKGVLPRPTAQSLQTMVAELHEHQYGTTLVVGDIRENPGISGGFCPSVPWDTIPMYSKVFEQHIRQIATGEDRPPPHSALLIGAALLRAAQSLALLGGTDGAIILDRELKLLGFGVRLTAPTPAEIFECDVLTVGTKRRTAPGASGTRLPSAIAFVASNPNTFAIVLSHDGPVSLVTNEGGAPLVVRGVVSLLPTLEG